MSSRSNSSTSSSSSQSSSPSYINQQTSLPRHVSSVCYPKGKWYDCLRPTTNPYRGFGSMANFADGATGKDNQMDVGESWTRDVYGKMK
ncbi:hypothetical protein RBB50_010825 [Rhinocladiella similis]